MEPVAACDGVAFDVVPRAAGIGVAQPGPVGVEIGDLGGGHAEMDRVIAVVGEPSRDEVFDHLRLRVDGDGPAAGQSAEVDVVPLAVELQVDATVLKTLAVEPGGKPGLAQQRDAAILEHARALPCLAVRPAADLDQHGVDAALREQVGEQEARRAGPDDAYLRASSHVLKLSRQADQNGYGAMSPRIVTQRVSVNASRLAVPPNRAPVPDARMPPNGVFGASSMV